MSDGEGNGGAASVLLGEPGAAGAAADPGAGAGGEAGAPGAGGGEGGEVDPDWYANLSTEVADGEKASLRDFVKARGAKTIDQLAKGLLDAQRAIHDKGIVKLPGEGASDEDRAAFNKAIGVPETADGYALEAPLDGDGKPVELNAPLLDRLAKAAHKAGMPAEAYKAVVGEFVAAQMEEQAGLNVAKQAEAVDWANGQGDKRAAKLAAVDRGAQALGLEDGEVHQLRDSLGAKRAMDIMARLGEGVGEDVLTGGGGGRQSFVNADQAQVQLDQMKADPSTSAAIFVKGSPENVRYNRLQAIVGEAANRRAAAGG